VRPASRRRRLRRLLPLGVAVLVACLAAPVRAGDEGTVPHLRATDARILERVKEGCRRSSTFRRLVEEVEHSDLIVYFEATGQVPRTVQAYVQLAGAAPTVRFLRIAVKIPASADTLIAHLGHELQHATEIARATEVRDQAGMEALYRKIGDQNAAGWDTAAARRVGLIVLDELRHETHSRKAGPQAAGTPHPDARPADAAVHASVQNGQIK
jgi:hypothetical protein